MARLREGRANTARCAAHFLRETVGRVRYAGARGQLTVRADSGFYTHAIVAVCRRMDVLLLHQCQSASLRSLIEAIPEHGLDAHPLLDGRRRRRGRNQRQARRRAGRRLDRPALVSPPTGTASSPTGSWGNPVHCHRRHGVQVRRGVGAANLIARARWTARWASRLLWPEGSPARRAASICPMAVQWRIADASPAGRTTRRRRLAS